jgi:predicted phosphodiesterase
VKIAILADIHGNLPALEAVLADLAREQPDQVYVAGDLVNRCPWSSEVLTILRETGWPMIQGNHDLILSILDPANPPPPFGNRARFPDLWWTWARLSPEARDFLGALPPDMVIDTPGGPRIRMVHGIPGDPFVGFDPGATETNRRRAAPNGQPLEESILIAGHTHIPMREWVDDLQILNPGGVGISHNGDPRAHYLILDSDEGSWRPDFRVVDYDHERVAAEFYASGFMEFAGPMGELHLRTVLTGHAWASDFNYWMRDQPPAVHANIARAVETYLAKFPDEQRWAFPVGKG